VSRVVLDISIEQQLRVIIAVGHTVIRGELIGKRGREMMTYGLRRSGGGDESGWGEAVGHVGVLASDPVV
jgi:hypothetical protein